MNSKLKDIFGTCETCGDPAVVVIRDLESIANHRTGMMEYKPAGPAHRYCIVHKRESITTPGLPIGP